MPVSHRTEGVLSGESFISRKDAHSFLMSSNSVSWNRDALKRHLMRGLILTLIFSVREIGLWSLIIIGLIVFSFTCWVSELLIRLFVELILLHQFYKKYDEGGVGLFSGCGFFHSPVVIESNVIHILSYYSCRVPVSYVRGSVSMVYFGIYNNIEISSNNDVFLCGLMFVIKHWRLTWYS